MRERRSVLHRGLIVAVLALVVLLLGTGPASAHAQLLASDPPADAVLAVAPQHVTLTFGEGVERADDSIQVFDDRVRRIDQHAVRWVGAGHRRIQVGLSAGLDAGSYIVSWHVASSDTHPVSGTFRFSIGAPTRVSGNVPDAGRNDTAGLLLGVVRALSYGGLALGPGALLVLLALWPAGLRDRRARGLLYTGGALLAVSAVGGILLQGVWSSSRPLSSIWSAPSTLNTHSQRFDTLYAVRFYLLLLFALVVTMATSRRVTVPPGVRRALLASTGLATVSLLVTWSLAGHAAVGVQPPLALTADVVHLMAMSIWLGGLAVLLVPLRPASRASDLAAVLPRFSRLAFGCVATLIVSGVYQSWREVGTLPALTHTTFGQVLLVKLIGVVLLLALGNIARRWVQRNLIQRVVPAELLVPAEPVGAAATRARSGAASAMITSARVELRPAAKVGGPHLGPDPQQLHRLRRGVAAEALVGAAVLSLTAALVVTVPARASFVRHFVRTVHSESMAVQVRVDKPRTGDAVLRLRVVGPAGRAMPILGLTGSLSLPARGLGPLPLRLPTKGGSAPTGVEDVGLTFPRSGEWTLQFTVRTSPLDATAFTVTVGVT